MKTKIKIINSRNQDLTEGIRKGLRRSSVGRRTGCRNPRAEAAGRAIGRDIPPPRNSPNPSATPCQAPNPPPASKTYGLRDKGGKGARGQGEAQPSQDIPPSAEASSPGDPSPLPPLVPARSLCRRAARALRRSAACASERALFVASMEAMKEDIPDQARRRRNGRARQETPDRHGGMKTTTTPRPRHLGPSTSRIRTTSDSGTAPKEWKTHGESYASPFFWSCAHETLPHKMRHLEKSAPHHTSSRYRLLSAPGVKSSQEEQR